MKSYKAAEAILRGQGFREILTLCSSSGDAGTEFGTLYTRGGEVFWLNHKTLPSILELA